MNWQTPFAAWALAGLAAPASGVPLDGRYDVFVDAAAACVRATGPKGVDRKQVASAGWETGSSAETDDKLLSWVHKERNPFVVQINRRQPFEPEHCWLVAEFKKQRDFDRVQQRLERHFGRAPDLVETDDMRTTRWTNIENVLDLWMMPASKLCWDCPQMFVTVDPRRSE